MSGQNQNVSLNVLHRIHDAFAMAEGRRLSLPMDTDDGSPSSRAPTAYDILTSQRTGSMHGLLPETQAPLKFSCPICMEDVEKGKPQQLLNCGHKFCSSCFQRWASTQGQHNTSCPMCRTPVTHDGVGVFPGSVGSFPGGIGEGVRGDPPGSFMRGGPPGNFARGGTQWQFALSNNRAHGLDTAFRNLTHH